MIGRRAPSGLARLLATAAITAIVGPPAAGADRSAALTVPEERRALEKALARARARGDPETPKIVQELVDNLIEQEEFGAARAVADAELARVRVSGPTPALGMVLTAAGDVRFATGDFEGALALFTEAESLLAREPDCINLAVARRSIGVVLRHQGRLEESAGWLEAAVKSGRAQDDPSALAASLENLAWTYMALGDGGRAGALFEEAAGQARLSGNERALAHALLRVGIYHMGSDEPESALPLFDEALEIIRRLGMKQIEEWAMVVTARTLATLGRLDEAIAIEEQILARPLSPAYREEGAGRLGDMGTLLLSRDPAEALGYLDRARELAAREGWPYAWRFHVNAGRALRALGRLDESEARYQEALVEIESLRGQLAAESWRSVFLEQHRGVYEELALVQYARHRAGAPEAAEQAFLTLERAKARSLVESLVEDRAAGAAAPDDPLSARRAEIEKRITGLQQRLSARGTTIAERQALLAALEAAEEDWIRWESDVRLRDPRFGAFHHPQPLGVEGARALLDERTALVAWLVTEEGPMLFVLTRSRFDLLHLDTPMRALRERIEGYLDLLGRDDGAWRAVSRRLSRELIEPALRVLPASVDRLILLPDDALHFLPFETLLVPGPAGGGERFLVEDRTIAYAPSASALDALRRTAGAASRAGDPVDMLVVANPDPGSAASGEAATGAAMRRAFFEGEGLEIGPIPRSVAEGRAVVAFGGKGSELYVGADASEAMVKREAPGRFGILHFATHGLVSPEQPERSALWLAPGSAGEDGFLQVREIRDLRLTAGLVVLSACRTAGGRMQGGEGVEGLARAFLEAGAPAVVASLWDVDDDTTAGFMRSAYGHLAAGMNTADALRAAKLDLIHSRPDAPPRTWAAFVLIGSGDSALSLRAPASRNRTALGVAAAVAALVAAWLARRAASRHGRYGASRPD